MNLLVVQLEKQEEYISTGLSNLSVSTSHGEFNNNTRTRLCHNQSSLDGISSIFPSSES